MAEVPFQRKCELFTVFIDRLIKRFDAVFVVQGIVDMDVVIKTVGAKKLTESDSEKILYTQIAHNYRKYEALQAIEQLPADMDREQKIQNIEQQFRKLSPIKMHSAIFKEIREGDFSVNQEMLRMKYTGDLENEQGRGRRHAQDVHSFIVRQPEEDRTPRPHTSFQKTHLQDEPVFIQKTPSESKIIPSGPSNSTLDTCLDILFK